MQHRKSCISAPLIHLNLPEGHREPHSHHHVGGAPVLGRENGLEITPNLKKHTQTQTDTRDVQRESNKCKVNRLQTFLKTGFFSPTVRNKKHLPESLSSFSVNKDRKGRTQTHRVTKHTIRSDKINRALVRFLIYFLFSYNSFRSRPGPF